MTAAELRALLEKATPGKWKYESHHSLFSVFTNLAWVGNTDVQPDAALIVALRNNAERFAELLAAEERAAVITWAHDPVSIDETDYNAMLNGEVVGWVWSNRNGTWFGHDFNSEDGADYPTEAAARAAVEDAVRAGR